MTFTIEKVSNMVFAGTEDHIWKAWDEDEFTERKMNNWIKKIQKDFNGKAVIINKVEF